jgi:hypothetical protein
VPACAALPPASMLLLDLRDSNDDVCFCVKEGKGPKAYRMKCTATPTQHVRMPELIVVWVPLNHNIDDLLGSTYLPATVVNSC